MDLCPCSTGRKYQDCCEPFHKGAAPETAVKLMRSRYSAYALGLADYIIETTHPLNPHFQLDRNTWRKQILDFSENTDFRKLEILAFSEGKYEAEVTFTAFLKQGGKDATFTERSHFLKVNNRWLYYSGTVSQGALA